MATFRALNIESDDESDVEIDDTKELQIEEALKLYQNALRFHSEGPASFDQAAQAYEELFRSEIFLYPESQSELRRIELYGALPERDGPWQDGLHGQPAAIAGTFDNGPSTLPQVLHLSYKNYAQFKLEHLTAKIEMFNVNLNQILSDATAAIRHFVEALDKDDTDVDLWRRTARVGDMLDSKRVARFCLEAVLDGDDEGLDSILSLPGLEEGLAGEQLRELVMQLHDNLSLLQSSLSAGKRNVLSKMLKQRLSSYEQIFDREATLKQGRISEQHEPQRTKLKVPKSWAEMGEILLRQLTDEQHGTGSKDPAIAVSFDFEPAGKSVDKFLEPNSPRLARHEPALTIQAKAPTSTAEEVSGLPKGQSTALPQKMFVDADAEMSNEQPDNMDADMTGSPALTLPTRKRSGDAAGLNEGPEEGRTKSKRTRTRDSTTVDERQAHVDANLQWEFEQQLNEFAAADDWMFETVGNLFERIGVVGFEASKDVRQELHSPESEDEDFEDARGSARASLKLARSDIYKFLNNYSDQLAQTLTVGGESLDIMPGQSMNGVGGSLSSGSNSKAVAKPVLPASNGLLTLLEEINGDWLMLKEVVWRWLCKLLRPNDPSAGSPYCEYIWPEDLKTMIVRTLVNFNESVYQSAQEQLVDCTRVQDTASRDQGLIEMIETIFELHLDIYCLIKQPNSGVDADTVAAQADRLHHWAELAREAMCNHSQRSADANPQDELDIRFLWATTFNMNAASDVTQDHAIECLNDMRMILVNADSNLIQLQNNAIMPELSITALDREISRLTTKDFFLRVTSQDAKDPVAMIESLEPLLDAVDESLSVASETEAESDASTNVPRELIRFLQSSDISVRLLLWQRLRDAYLAIDYKPMVISCYFKMIRVILNEIKILTTATALSDRQMQIFRSLRLIQDLTMKALTVIQSCIQRSQGALETLDEVGLKTAVSTFGEVLQLLQVFNVSEDSIRVGQSQVPTLLNGSTAPSFKPLNALVHDMQVHSWIILYMLFKEAIFQVHDLFPIPAEDMFDFLRAVHRNLGLRGICGNSNRVFVRMLKDEFFQMTHVDGYDSEQAQVLYDLYGLNCFLNPNYELIEHHCTHDAFLDRGVAMQAVDLLIQQASKLPIRDLVKHPLKDTIDKVHGSAPRKKPTEAIMRNREIQRAFLRSSINPLDLYSCLKGEGSQLNVSPIPKEDATLASKGWYFLMGHIALAKFRSQKRTGPTPTEDVDIAIAFFMQDLEYSMHNWETWFRLAQAYDTKIEESVVWSAEKLNNSMQEIVQLQRAAIHCYIMATSLAYRSADLENETSEKMIELFSDFAMRLYASSREPFRMLPFALEDTEKFLSFVYGVAKGKPFKPLRVYTAWKMAKVLFQKALAGKPDSWTLHFILGKCLWKMHAASNKVKTPHDVPPSAQQVLRNFIKAIELIPDKKDSREKREPILEPHYKLISIVHKLVVRAELDLEQAKEALSNSSYGRTITCPEESDDWVPHVLAMLKNLRSADKSNWHHRMVARAAQIVYNDSDQLGAMGAKHELTQQMFTKTMVLQVWRPECERAGRHFVYTARYTRFFVRILEQLKDRNNLEQLARRVRRRPHDLFEHAHVWQDICGAYIRLLRSHAVLPEGLETSTFSTIAYEDFLIRKEPLEKWMQMQDNGASAALDVLREVQELKKINQSLMKPGPIDDLIGDVYAYLFNTIGKQLWDEERRIKQEEEASRPPPPAASPPRNPMMSLTHLMNVDGATDSSTAPASSALPQQTQSAADQVPVRKKIGVGRREIRTCAESCLQKANIPASTSRTLVSVLIDSSKENVPGDASVETSAPGSIHDSADDESELSELEEEDEDDDGGTKVSPPRPMFPNLISAAESREASEGFEPAAEEPAPKEEDTEMGDDFAIPPLPIENGDQEVNGSSAN